MREFAVTILAYNVFISTSVLGQTPAARPALDASSAAIESARLTRDEGQLNRLKSEFEKRVAQNDCDALCYYEHARVRLYLADAYDLRKEKKLAVAATDQGIELAQHSLQVNDNSADAHALLADLYAHKIAFGGMFAGAKYGPKIVDEIKKGMALDDKNPRVWATQGRRYLMSPKMFGGDVAKAIESFKKSLELDGSRAETWSWLARAFKKQGESAKANEEMQKALHLEPQNPMVKAAAEEIAH